MKLTQSLLKSPSMSMHILIHYKPIYNTPTKICHLYNVIVSQAFPSETNYGSLLLYSTEGHDDGAEFNFSSLLKKR